MFIIWLSWAVMFWVLEVLLGQNSVHCVLFRKITIAISEFDDSELPLTISAVLSDHPAQQASDTGNR